MEDNRCTVPFTEPFSVSLDRRLVTACCKVNMHPIDETTGLLPPQVIELRKSILNNERSPHCSACWKRDDETGLTHRQRHSLHFRNPKYWKNKWETLTPEDPVTSVMLAFSNKCQLMCIYCSPGVSSMWENAPEKLLPFKHRFIKIERPPIDINDVADMDNMKRIVVSGGEPMLEPRAVNFLQTLRPNPNRDLGIITNLSYGDAVFSTLCEIVEKHQRIDVMSSLDSVGDNVTRKYINWELWSRNFEALIPSFIERVKVYPKISLGVIITVTILNYKDVQGVIEYILSFRKQGIRNLVFVISPISDQTLVSIKSGRPDPNYSIQLSQEDNNLLDEKEKKQIESYNKYLKGIIVDEELEKLTQAYLEVYLK